MIRALTIGLPLYTTSKAELVERTAVLVAQARLLAGEAGHELRTVRLSLPPLPPEHAASPGAVRSIVESVRGVADAVGARWYCLPVDRTLPGSAEGLDELATVVVREDRLFVNLIVADGATIGVQAASDAARFVLQLARRSRNGVDNFRVGVSACCPAGAPFFPFSRHDGGPLAFSFALETTGLALDAARQARSSGVGLEAFRSDLLARLVDEFTRADRLARAVAEASGAEYRGLDGSLAPLPGTEMSVARLVELLGPTPVGAHGTLFVTSVLTDVLRAAGVRSGAKLVGFNGVMYSVLEDEGLAMGSDLGAVGIAKLLAFSAVCGCGLDMVPVPATMSREDVASLILDVAALAVRLQKPLGVRLLPIPGRAVNEPTAFNLDFLCDSRVMDPGISASRPLLSASIWRYLQQRAEDEPK